MRLRLRVKLRRLLLLSDAEEIALQGCCEIRQVSIIPLGLRQWWGSKRDREGSPRGLPALSPVPPAG